MPATTAIRKRKQAYRSAVEVDVTTIRYTQTSVKDTFSNGAPLSWTIYMLKTGQIKPRELPLIRIGCVNNQWRTIDNRRLYCFKTAGMKKIPAIIMQDVSAEFVYKNQSYNDGLTINLIHDPPPNIDHNQMIMAYDPQTSECKRWKIITVIQQTKELKLMQTDHDNEIVQINHENINNNIEQKQKEIINEGMNNNNNINTYYVGGHMHGDQTYYNYYQPVHNVQSQVIPNTDMRRYHSDSTLLQMKNNNIVADVSQMINNKKQNNNENNNNNNENKQEDELKWVQYMDNDDNNHTNLLIHNLSKYHLQENVQNVSVDHEQTLTQLQTNINVNIQNNHVIDETYVKNHIFSVLNDLKQKYCHRQDLFFNVVEQYVKQRKK